MSRSSQKFVERALFLLERAVGGDLDAHDSDPSLQATAALGFAVCALALRDLDLLRCDVCGAVLEATSDGSGRLHAHVTSGDNLCPGSGRVVGEAIYGRCSVCGETVVRSVHDGTIRAHSDHEGALCAGSDKAQADRKPAPTSVPSEGQ
jgi:ribosomal protein S27E